MERPPSNSGQQEASLGEEVFELCGIDYRGARRVRVDMSLHGGFAGRDRRERRKLRKELLEIGESMEVRGVQHHCAFFAIAAHGCGDPGPGRRNAYRVSWNRFDVHVLNGSKDRTTFPESDD